MKSVTKKFSSIGIVTAGILWGCLGLVVRRLDALGLGSMEIVTVRAVVTCAAMFLYLLVFNRGLLKIRPKDLWCFLGTGICSIVFFNYCYFKAIAMTSLSVAAVLLYTAPCMVTVLSFFLFHETMTKRKLLALLLTFAGCVLVTGVSDGVGSVSFAGVLTGLGAGLGYALYSIFGRYALDKGYHSLTITFYTFLTAMIGATAISDRQAVFTTAFGSSEMMLLSAALGIAGTVVPYLCYTLGLRYVENGRASVLASVEPVVATLLGAVVFREKITLTGAAGVALVLCGLVLCREKGGGGYVTS